MATTDGNSKHAAIRGIIRRYYTVVMIYSCAGGFLFGVYPIFLRSRGLNQFQINCVLAAFFTVLVVADVPTGAFADARGRRLSFVIGAIFRVVSWTIYFSAHRFPVFLLAESIDGIGTTFCNGAIDAWGVDALDDAGYDSPKDRLFSRLSQLSSLGLMGSAVAGGYAANVNIAWPWLMGAAGFAISAVAGAILMHDRRPHAARIDVRSIPVQVGARVRDGLRLGFGIRPVLILSTAGAITLAAWAPYWLEWPLFFHDRYAVGVWIVGWIYCLFTLGRMIGAEIVVRIAADEMTRARRVSMLAICTGVLLFAAGSVGGRVNLALAILFVVNLLSGVSTPLISAWLNEHVPSEHRATVLSFNSTFQTVGGSGGLLAGGYVADAAGIPVGWQMAGLVALCAAPFYWALRPRAEPAAVAVGTAE
ncbi:MAG TPA: MFS transporter [Candidatus Binataceae bacterium]|nr:MFS transporter [Candidatus Binataceae bacterium]